MWRTTLHSVLDGTRSRAESLFLDRLPGHAVRDLVGQGLVIDVPAGTLVTREGFRERELYVVLGGHLDATARGHRIYDLGRGDLFGEDAFLAPEYGRRATIHARSDSRVLVLRGRAVDRLMKRDRALAHTIAEHLDRLLAARLPRPVNTTTPG